MTEQNVCQTTWRAVHFSFQDNATFKTLREAQEMLTASLENWSHFGQTGLRERTNGRARRERWDNRIQYLRPRVNFLGGRFHRYPVEADEKEIRLGGDAHHRTLHWVRKHMA